MSNANAMDHIPFNMTLYDSLDVSEPMSGNFDFLYSCTPVQHLNMLINYCDHTKSSKNTRNTSKYVFLES